MTIYLWQRKGSLFSQVEGVHLGPEYASQKQLWYLAGPEPWSSIELNHQIMIKSPSLYCEL